jgi:hypothetical protein
LDLKIKYKIDLSSFYILYLKEYAEPTYYAKPTYTNARE